MIDLQDLEDLKICKMCKVVYMPRMKPGVDYEKTLYPINNDFCERCENDNQ